MVSPKFLEKLAAYVPSPIARAIYYKPLPLTQPSARRFPAAVLLSDISGFTPLSERLGQAGPTGAEELTNLINRYFTEMIQLIEIYGGQVIKFSGDAIIVLFPAQETPLPLAIRQAGECALAMQAKMSDFTDLETSQGRASLSMKVGLGAGQVLECSVGGVSGRWEYLVGGDPLVQVARAEHLAQPGQIILSRQAWSRIQTFFRGEANRDDPDFVNLYKVLIPAPKPEPLALAWRKLNPQQRQQAAEALKGYIPTTITARLDEQTDWLAELRRMTILFAGIGGLDYEDPAVTERLQQFLETTQKLIRRFEGSFNKVAIDDKGTVLLILFGAPPYSHEDDAARAVAFSLHLQTIAREQNLRLSIGLTEGQVFAGPVGPPGRQEYTVLGDEVNMAARLMQYGRAGAIVVSGRVKARAGSQFITESLGQIALKGKAAALPAHLVKGEEGAQDQFMTRYLLHDDPLVGRKAELEQTRRVAGRARNGELQLLLIEGELGLGKSRLVSEMVREWVIAGSVGYGSKCISYGQQIPYLGWREILAAIYGLMPGLTPQQQLARLALGVADLEDPPDHSGYWETRLPLLSDVVGLKIPDNDFTRNLSGELRRNNTFALIEALLRRQAERRPLLIVIEDIHWADELTLALVAHLAKTMVNTSLLLVLAYRPPVSDKELYHLAEIKNFPYARRVRLRPLSHQESLDLIKMVLGDRPLPSDARKILLSRGQGNPFFLHEISQAILDVVENAANQPVQLLETLDLPDTVQDAVFMHVDRLPEAEKLTLKVASVIGARFQRSILSAVHPRMPTHSLLTAQLVGLENEKLIRMEMPAPKWEYVFHNVITQEIVYEGLLLAQRRQLHAAVGAVLEALAPDEIESLAFHYSRSDNWEMALQYLKQASQKAQREYANYAAINYYSEILTSLVNRPSPQQAGRMISADYWDILLERVKLYQLTGQRDNVVEDLGTLGLIAEALNDNRRRALAATQWAYLYEWWGDYASSLEMIERSIELAQQAGDERLVGEGYNQSGKLHYIRGEYETAEEHLQEALHLAQKHHDQSAQADCLNNLGLVAHYQTDYNVALYFFNESVDLYRTTGDQISLGNGLRYLGQVYYAQGQYMVALHCYNESLTLHQTIGDRVGEALTRHKLGQVYRSLGNYAEARRLLEQALFTHRATGDRQGEAHSLYHLGFLHCRLADYDTAVSYFGQSLTILREELDDPWGLAKALTYYSWTLIDLGQFSEARELLQETLKIEHNLELEALLIEDAVHLGRVALALKDLSLAQACVRHALRFIDQKGTQGIEHPAMIFLTCYHILEANQEFEHAQAVFEQAHQYISMQAARIDDPVLRGFYLRNIPENKALQDLAGQVTDSKSDLS